MRSMYINQNIQLVFYGFITFLLLACSGSKTIQKSPSFPDDLRISIYQGGGVAGIWRGYTIEANGSVMRWQGRLPETNPEVSGQLSPSELHTLWQAIQAADFFNVRLTNTGNLTTFIKIQASGRQNIVSWPSAESQAHQKLYRLYLLIKQAAEKDSQ